MTYYVAIDTETRLISYPDEVNPAGICLASHDDKGGHRLWHMRLDAEALENELHYLFSDPDCRIVGHNVAFDLHVILKALPGLWSVVWEALAAGRVHDTMLRERLLNLSTMGDVNAKPCSLAALTKRYLNMDISADKAEDAWRYRYQELEETPLEEWPAEAVRYAEDDARLTLEVFQAQEARRVERGPGSINQEHVQVGAAFALKGMTIQGMRIDPEAVQDLKASMEKRYALALTELKKYGIIRENGTRDQKSLEVLCKDLGVTATTASGRIATDRKTLNQIVSDDPRLAAYREYSDTIKAVTTFVPQLSVRRVHPDFNPIVNTLRTSCRASDYYKRFDIEQEIQRVIAAEVATKDEKELKKLGRKYESLQKKYACTSTVPSINLQQIPRSDAFRQCFIPEKGNVLICADYGNLELVCAAQTYYRLFGSSDLREVLNSGTNLHDKTGTIIYNDYCGQNIDVARFRELIKEGCKDAKFCRQSAKFVNLGCPGGQSASTICKLANGLGIPITDEQAVKWREAARGRFKEFVKFFGSGQGDGYLETLKRGHMYIQVDGKAKKTQRYDIEVAGVYRAKCTYTAAANGISMQMPAALGKKIAMIKIYRMCTDPRYSKSALNKCTMHLDMHDELILSAPKDIAEQAQYELCQHMIIGMAKICPDMQISVESGIMDRWYKDGQEGVGFVEFRGNKNGISKTT